MLELAGQLLPEMVGLAVTPAAVVACLLLLGSSHPYRNVVALAAPFLAVYGVLSVIALVAGRAADAASDDPSTTRGWVSVVVGVLFLAVAAMSWRRPLQRPAERALPRRPERAGRPSRSPRGSRDCVIRPSAWCSAPVYCWPS